MKPALTYTALRLGMLVAFGGLAYAAGMRGWLLLLVAFIGSGLVSLFVLDRQRARFGSSIGSMFSRINDRIDAATRAEDDEAIAVGSGPQGAGSDRNPAGSQSPE